MLYAMVGLDLSVMTYRESHLPPSLVDIELDEYKPGCLSVLSLEAISGAPDH